MARPVRTDRNNKTLVVAHYREDLSWLKDVPEDVFVQIVSKGDEPPRGYQYTTRANKGREPESYLSYIVENYDSLTGDYWFTQGNPFDHYPDFVLEVGKGLTGDFNWLAKDPSKYMIANPDGSPHDEGMNLHAMHRLFYNGPLPDTYPFHPACLVAVSAERLHRYPKEIYEKLLAVVPLKRNAWAFERIIGHLWGDVV